MVDKSEYRTAIVHVTLTGASYRLAHDSCHMLTAIENCKLVATKNAYGWPSLFHTLPPLAVTGSTEGSQKVDQFDM